MKNIRVFLSENFQFLEVKSSIYLNRRVFVMNTTHAKLKTFDMSSFLGQTSRFRLVRLHQ